jgi:hypothetical protein
MANAIEIIFSVDLIVVSLTSEFGDLGHRRTSMFPSYPR